MKKIKESICIKNKHIKNYFALTTCTLQSNLDMCEEVLNFLCTMRYRISNLFLICVPLTTKTQKNRKVVKKHNSPNLIFIFPSKLFYIKLFKIYSELSLD